MRYKKFTGCDEDCLNCKYPDDCLKPVSLMKSDKLAKEAFKVNKGDSQSRMYTLEIRGIGKSITKNYYL